MHGSSCHQQDIITIEPSKRGGRPAVRRMGIALADVLGWLAAGMSHEQIISDYPSSRKRTASRDRREMKLLFDQNISFKLCRSLADLFADSNRVRLVELLSVGDRVVGK
jgi:uncharacterized protein (DUF433 family)